MVFIEMEEILDPDQDYNIDPEIAWLEEISLGGFRIWQLLFFCFAALLSVVVVLCCCFRFRIPRTKQDIEADYQRKRIAKKFRERLAHIKNSEMDEMDLQKVLARIQADFMSETKNCDTYRTRGGRQTITSRNHVRREGISV